ncbi:hypothetical protein SAMN04487996_12284 [Dyadobacter soli]|uniref:Uncharacterized protein n=1 Tax=Dyadobacter soli TaxID=659014 RepID=A0A1G7WKZ3_9BACT|nr:hypothetical protein [Dyadobacter soli]SDG72538.1 hypothetical protein SAMN04487996_12284 [Dyadobacter soli]
MSTTRFYKIQKGTETFQKVADMIVQIRAANKAAENLAIEIGSTGQMIHSDHYVAGGITGFEFYQQPEGWRKASKHFHGYYFPKSGKENKQTLNAIYALPKIERRTLSALIGYKGIFSQPGIMERGEYVLVVATVGNMGSSIEPTPDMIEILGSEYDELAKKLEEIA